LAIARCLSGNEILDIPVALQVLGQEREIMHAGVGLVPPDGLGLHRDAHEREAQELFERRECGVLLENEVLEANGRPSLGLWCRANDFHLILPRDRAAEAFVIRLVVRDAEIAEVVS
jgi:hypothetical protein